MINRQIEVEFWHLNGSNLLVEFVSTSFCMHSLYKVQILLYIANRLQDMHMHTQKYSLFSWIRFVCYFLFFQVFFYKGAIIHISLHAIEKTYTEDRRTKRRTQREIRLFICWRFFSSILAFVFSILVVRLFIYLFVVALFRSFCTL